MPRGTFSITLEPTEFRNLIRLLNALPKEVQQKVRDEALPLSKRLAGQLYMFAMQAPSPQAKLVAQSIEAKRDRLIRVDIGGSKAVGRPYRSRKETLKSGKGKTKRAPAGALLWGSEHGSHQGIDAAGRSYTNRFAANSNKYGYWINPATDFYAPVVAREYTAMVVGIVRDLGLD